MLRKDSVLERHLDQYLKASNIRVRSICLPKEMVYVISLIEENHEKMWANYKAIACCNLLGSLDFLQIPRAKPSIPSANVNTE